MDVTREYYEKADLAMHIRLEAVILLFLCSVVVYGRGLIRPEMQPEYGESACPPGQTELTTLV